MLNRLIILPAFALLASACQTDGPMTVDGYSGKIVTITQGDTRYVGEMKDNKMHGRGKLSMRNGFKLEGEFIEGKLHGTTFVTHPNGDMKVCDFNYGKPSMACELRFGHITK